MKIKLEILRTSVFALALAALALPGSLVAQVCKGGIPHSASAVQGQAAVEVEKGSTLIGLSGGKGGEKWFGMASLGVRSYDARDGETIIFGFGGGRTFKTKFTGTARHCLDIRGEFGTGPDRPGTERADESSSNMTLEFSTGVPLASSSSLAITPFATAGIRYASIVTQFEENSVANKDFYEFFSAGVGLSVGGDVSVQPYALFPLSRDIGGDPVFGMRVSMAIGARPSR
jgi:hypothetical protein